MYACLFTAAGRYEFHSFSSTAHHARLKLADPKFQYDAMCQGRLNLSTTTSTTTHAAAGLQSDDASRGPLPMEPPHAKRLKRRIAALEAQLAAARQQLAKAHGGGLGGEPFTLSALASPPPMPPPIPSPMLTAIAAPVPAGGEARCIGPFPFVCGPLIVLGRRLVETLLDEPTAKAGLSADLAAIRSLPLSHRTVLEDAWLGSALFRFVGAAAPLGLFTTGGKPLYVDDSRRFRGMRSVVVWHNRLKFVARPAVLYHYHTARNASHHCSLPVAWQYLKPHCCGEASRLGEKMEGRRPSVDMHAWALFAASPNTSACAAFPTAEPLLDKRSWEELGIPLDPEMVSLVEKA